MSSELGISRLSECLIREAPSYNVWSFGTSDRDMMLWKSLISKEFIDNNHSTGLRAHSTRCSPVVCTLPNNLKHLNSVESSKGRIVFTLEYSEF